MINIIVNGKKFDEVEEKDLIASLMTMYFNHVKFAPPEAIRNILNNIFDLAEEINPSIYLLKKIKSLKSLLNKVNDESLQKFYINTLLSFEGLGNLSGFNIADTETHKGGKKRIIRHYTINPEKT